MGAKMTNAQRLPIDRMPGSIDAAFAGPCVRYFSFLEKQRGFKGDFFGVAGETTVSYEKGNCRIDIFFNIPEAPSCQVCEVKDGRDIKVKKIIPSSDAAKVKIKEMNSLRDKEGLERWHTTLKNGGFNEAIDLILKGISEEVKKTLLP
ncbi:MAG: hypothetical protein IPN19_07180 [Elusimicrobia bacterium]|nr:hypothetical protein [Elusimicrobiota bacterium]